MDPKALESRGWWETGASKVLLNITPESQVPNPGHRNKAVGADGFPPLPEEI